MSRPANTWTEWTYSEYARFPDDGDRYEVIDGEVLVTPAPGTQHQRVAFRLITLLQAYVSAHGLGEMLWDVDLLFVEGQFLRPDMLFVPTSQAHRATDRGMEGVPGLIVEVQSPSSVSIDRVKKPRRYRDFGVPEYWVVDPVERAVLVWRFAQGATEPETALEWLHWSPDPSLAPVRRAVAALFA